MESEQTVTENKQISFAVDPNQSNDSFLIKINVTDPIIKDGITKYVLYSIRGSDKDGSFEIYRRFSDFATLRKVLVKRWPGVYVPPIPEKKAVGNMDAKFIEERRSLLEKFCVKVAELPHLFYSDEFKLFIRSVNVDLEKALNALPEMNPEELIKKYEINFSQLSGKEINTEIVLKITSFQNYTKKISSMLKNFREIAKKTSKARQSFNDQFTTFSNYMLPEYEKNCLTEYLNGNEDKLIFLNKLDDKMKTIFSALKENFKVNSYEEFSALLKAEINDINAFQDCLNMKLNYETHKNKQETKLKDNQIEMQKILAGKTTIGSLFSKGNKEEKLSNIEKQITALKAEISNLQFLCDIITVILGYIEIDRFKDEKQGKYFKIIKSMAHAELEYSKVMQEYWGFIADQGSLANI